MHAWNLHSQKRASSSKSAITKPISGCVRIACSSLMITSLLQVANETEQVHQLAASLQMSSCSKSDVHRLHASQQAWFNLLANCIRPVKSTACIKSAAFLAMQNQRQTKQQQQQQREQGLKTRLRKLRYKQWGKPLIRNFTPYASLK